jgi:hypothetical protein
MVNVLNMTSEPTEGWWESDPSLFAMKKTEKLEFPTRIEPLLSAPNVVIVPGMEGASEGELNGSSQFMTPSTRGSIISLKRTISGMGGMVNLTVAAVRSLLAVEGGERKAKEPLWSVLI